MLINLGSNNLDTQALTHKIAVTFSELPEKKLEKESVQMAKKTAVKKKAPAKKRAAAKKPTAKKKAPAKKSPAKKKAVAKMKAPAKKKAPAKSKAAAKKPPAKKKAVSRVAKPAKKPAAKKAAPKKTTSSKPTGKNKIVSKSSSKSAPAKSAPRAKKSLKPKAKRVAGQGLLIRLKASGDDQEAQTTKRKVAATEMSKGETPIELHHRKPTKKEFKELRELLVARRNQLAGDVADLEAEAFNSETQKASGNHLADSSFEQYEQEFNLSMIENESEELREIAVAIEKLDKGNFGVCESCGIDISIERLRVMTYSRICIDCRSRFEEEGGGEKFGVFPERRV